MEPTGNNNTLPPTGTTTYPTISSDGGQQYGTQINISLGGTSNGGGVVSIYSTDFVLAQNV